MGRSRGRPYADHVENDANPRPGLTVRGDGPPIVMIHGFTQTRACWGPFAENLAEDHRLLLLDAPGHADSSVLRADLVEGADLLAQAVGRGTYLGYSMGGRFALHIALQHPELVERLILISTTAGMDDDAERARRREADDTLATHIEDIGVEMFVDEWLAQPMFSSLGADAALADLRKANTATGLASSLRLAGTGTQSPLWLRIHELDMPVLVIAGANDAKFLAHARRLVETIGPNAELEIIPEVGHSAQLEDPRATAMIVREWLSRR
jgi:2-succinyl-6-hydroxy-2,4-cyclohexadiene-1-carboxylate synthase